MPSVRAMAYVDFDLADLGVPAWSLVSAFALLPSIVAFRQVRAVRRRRRRARLGCCAACGYDLARRRGGARNVEPCRRGEGERRSSRRCASPLHPPLRRGGEQPDRGGRQRIAVPPLVRDRPRDVVLAADASCNCPPLTCSRYRSRSSRAAATSFGSALTFCFAFAFAGLAPGVTCSTTATAGCVPGGPNCTRARGLGVGFCGPHFVPGTRAAEVAGRRRLASSRLTSDS